MTGKDISIAAWIGALIGIPSVLIVLAVFDWIDNSQTDIDRVSAGASEVQKKVEEYDKVCNGYKDKLDQCMDQLRFCRGY